MKIGEKQAGTFTVAPGMDIFGELTISGPSSTLYLRHTEFFRPIGQPGNYINGVLHDMTKVSLIDCVGAPVPGTASNPDGHYHFADVFPNYILCGDQHLSPDEASITAIEFSIDDAATLFRDASAFGWIHDANDLIEGVLAKEPPMHTRRIGSEAQLIYFAGTRQIFSAQTVLGTISASHNPVPHLEASDVGFKNTITIDIVLADPIRFADAIFRTARVIEFMAMIVGRPQNLLALHLLTTEVKSQRGLTVHPTMFPKREASTESEKPHSFDVLIDAVDRPDHFADVIQNWFGELATRHGARWRFYNCFARQKSYDIDRLVGAANMFDILPDSAVPAEAPLSEEVQTAQAQARQLFRALPSSSERNSILSALGRIGKSSLKHKIRHRAKIVLDLCGDRFPELLLVTDEAVNCRNYYVHGGQQVFDYDKNFNAVVFFTETLEFVFATSDLIDAGWDMKAWIAHGTSMSHRFGAYWASYDLGLRALKALLAQPSALAQAG